MGSSARSFEVRTERPERVLRQALNAAEECGGSGFGVLLLTGDLVRFAATLAEKLSADTPIPWLLASARGVLTERGEIENEAAAAGLVVPNVNAEGVLGSSIDSRFGSRLAERLAQHRRASALIFSSAAPDRDGWLVELSERLPGRLGRVFGAGTLPGTPIFWVPAASSPTRGLQSADTAAVILESALVPHVVASSACRLISPLLEVNQLRGALLLRLDGEPALPQLSQAAHGLRGEPLILLAVAVGDRPLGPEGRSLSIRAIVGVDPNQGGILLAEELEEGAKVAFAVRDAHAARTDLEAHLGAQRRSLSGSAPQFGFFVSCAGRGRGLYQAPDVDVRLVRDHYAEMPLLGLHSTFELSPEGDKLGLRVYTAVLGVFAAPS
jgi:small ligand-binding sensory domain FIST